MGYDVFISYRRRGGSVVARLLQSELERDKYSVFLDVDSLREGHFDENLFRHIENSKSFVVVLTAGCLDRCVNEEDWLRKEIAHAFKIGKHVIPVMMPDFEFPVDLPADIRELPRHNAVSYSHDYFKGTMEKLRKFLQAGLAEGQSPTSKPALTKAEAVKRRSVLDLFRTPPAEAPKPAPAAPVEAGRLQPGAKEDRRIAEEKRVAEEKRIAEARRVAEAKWLTEEKRIAEEKRLADERRRYSAAVGAGEAAFKKQDYEAAAREAGKALEIVPGGAEALALTERLLPTLEVRSQVDGRDVSGAVIGFSGKASAHTTPMTFKVETGKTYEVSVSLPAADGKVYTPASKTFVADWRGPRVWTAGLEASKPRFSDLRLEPVILMPPTLRVPAGCRAAEGAGAEPYTNSGWAQEIVHAATGMVFRYIPPGTFTMGSPAGELGRSDDEVQHRVTLTRGFYLGKYPVTQAQWEKATGANPSHFKGADLPVETVSWDYCQGFLKKLGAGARLPTEAEWEYACRAGTAAALNSGKALTSKDGRCPNLDEVAWYRENSERKTHPVGQKRPNAWGLHDMHGNVWEWCSDWYGAYPTGTATDPQGAQSGSNRVLRGGSWSNNADRCRAANRNFFTPDNASDRIGFRVVLPPGQQ